MKPKKERVFDFECEVLQRAKIVEEHQLAPVTPAFLSILKKGAVEEPEFPEEPVDPTTKPPTDKGSGKSKK